MGSLSKNYPSCFIVYCEIKKIYRKNRPISLFRQSHSTPGPFRANSTRVRLRGFALCRYFREQCEKTRRHDRRKFFPVGGTVWYRDRVTNHSKPSSIGQKHTLFCELLKVACDWLFRPQTTVETTDNRV